MAKYIGIISLIVGLTTFWYLENKTSNNKLIILDYINAEFSISNNNLNYLYDLKKRRIIRDSTAIFMVELLEDIRQNNPYSKNEREVILSKLNDEKEPSSNTANIALFNILCNKLIMQRAQINKQLEYTLVVNGIKNIESGSMDLSLTPIKIVKDTNQIEYYFENDKISKKQLKNFEGKLANLEAKIINPITKESFTVKGK